jgi:hypothetical protein
MLIIPLVLLILGIIYLIYEHYVLALKVSNKIKKTPPYIILQRFDPNKKYD